MAKLPKGQRRRRRCAGSWRFLRLHCRDDCCTLLSVRSLQIFSMRITSSFTLRVCMAPSILFAFLVRDGQGRKTETSRRIEGGRGAEGDKEGRRGTTQRVIFNERSRGERDTEPHDRTWFCRGERLILAACVGVRKSRGCSRTESSVGETG